jgi:starch synthase (maltosyl-transferring)
LGKDARVPAAPSKPPPRIQIENPQPLIDGGRYRAKACVGDVVDVSAILFRDGHDRIRAVVRYRGPSSRRWSEAPMRHVDAHIDGDTWEGAFPVEEQGHWRWSIEAWTDHFATWREELARKLDAGQRDLSSELAEGALLLRDAAGRAGRADAKLIEQAARVIGDEDTPAADRQAQALDPGLQTAVERYPDRTDASAMERPIEVDVDRLRARFGSWYELFPRSWGGFAGVTAQLPRLAELGFDVLYLPPIHPIGRTNRKGANNSLTAGPRDPGSPWAIGFAEGGHTAVHPDLGTLADFDRMVSTGREHGIEIALDFAIQCSADHPWLREHPEWFHHRPDGTLKYAENPPKRYQDIYNVNFDSPDWRGLWQALKEVVDFWVDHGVRVFRVDNPHTKPLAFWEWLIGEVRSREPDVIFLAEAFTRAAMMRTLAKVGFNQSYTYFTWKNSRHELSEYVTELTTSGMQHYYRPNFFVNTPDILTEYLQRGGPPAFSARLLLGATLSPSYGIYSGFERFENAAVAAGSEEYLDSEKYEIKRRTLDGPLLPLVGRLNQIRRLHPALQRVDNVSFLATENDGLIAYAKHTESETLIIVVNIDPYWSQEGVVIVPYELGLPPVFPVVDLLSGEHFDWHIGRNYVRLDPALHAAHVMLADHHR